MIRGKFEKLNHLEILYDAEIYETSDGEHIIFRTSRILKTDNVAHIKHLFYSCGYNFKDINAIANDLVIIFKKRGK